MIVYSVQLSQAGHGFVASADINLHLHLWSKNMTPVGSLLRNPSKRHVLVNKGVKSTRLLVFVTQNNTNMAVDMAVGIKISFVCSKNVVKNVDVSCHLFIER